MDIILHRTIEDMTYKELRDFLDEEEETMDLAEIQNWLEQTIADNLHKRSEYAETLKKACHLALLYIDFAIEPGKGVIQ